MFSSKSTKEAQLSNHTVSPSKDGRITTDYGVTEPTDASDITLTAGQRGPHLVEDSFAREALTRFDHERIPERVVHARGTAAHGTFRLTRAVPELCLAPILNDTSRETDVFVRFSTVQGSRGSADTVRDVRGFAVKMYTKEGNWDIVGNNIPVFFIQDSVKFPDFVHAVKPEPHNEVPQGQTAHNNFWDFVYLHTEATHMYAWAMSDRAIPRSFRMMAGFGVNTFVLVNDKGERHFVKFHWTPVLGVHSLVWDEALKLAGQDPDFHRKDLTEAIDKGSYPRWNFGLQVIPEAKENDFDFDVLDATKIWPEDLVPVTYIGELELNRNVDEFFTETEQVAFCTAHMPSGVLPSNDPLLQGRNFSYFDTQLSRLGTNWQELPINQPVCPVMNFHRDGKMRHTISRGTVNYYPNRFGIQPPAAPGEGAYVDPSDRVAGAKGRVKGEKFAEHFAQAQLFYNSMSEIEKKHMAAAFAFELDHCDDPIVYERMSVRLADIDLGLARTVAKLVGGPVPDKAGRPNDGRSAPRISQTEFPGDVPTIETRRVAIIIADGFDLATFNSIKGALESLKALPIVIGPRRSPILSADASPSSSEGLDEPRSVKPDHHLEGMRSTMFDAVFVPGGAASVKTLSESGRALHWLREAFGHLKAVAGTAEAVELFKLAFPLPQITVSLDEQAEESYGVVTQAKVSQGEIGKVPKDIGKDGTGLLDKFFYRISQHRAWDRELDGLNESVAY